MSNKLSMLDPKTQTPENERYYSEIEEYFQHSAGDVLARLRDFPKYVPRQNLSHFLAKNEIFKEILDVHGHIVECGVFMGGGLLTWAQLSAIYEPYNHVRRIVGFDTFAGFPSIAQQDKPEQGAEVDFAKVGGLAVQGIEADIKRATELYDLNRPIGHIPRIELVKGDASDRIPKYVEENRHLVVALLYLDFDLYEPTLAALNAFLPRMPKGAVIAFDELNQKQWPGETLAVLDAIGIKSLRIKRFPFTPQISYAVLE
ncbi:dTDP-6-deoxy-L-hexose 3-O-methyltransferase [Bradyrhizobium diazoefficiens]|uniref:TylF/MycF/NovP-related O-methyltransferase n=1 Tax=Bradyrhizobium diazoefficiens TaxID=1355477 RepID=UPI000BEABBC0|nr:TylF/MycF/NovP-related O-methyltransferase [Bradyrhizobium diazoefficiens]PDT58080.1 dTDP-6-deoxy-L-hexose 3-O-methyltransferase [Bradyrhizobium diazoefficiens]